MSWGTKRTEFYAKDFSRYTVGPVVIKEPMSIYYESSFPICFYWQRKDDGEWARIFRIKKYILSICTLACYLPTKIRFEISVEYFVASMKIAALIKPIENNC